MPSTLPSTRNSHLNGVYLMLRKEFRRTKYNRGKAKCREERKKHGRKEGRKTATTAMPLLADSEIIELIILTNYRSGNAK